MVEANPSILDKDTWYVCKYVEARQKFGRQMQFTPQYIVIITFGGLKAEKHFELRSRKLQKITYHLSRVMIG